MILIVQFNGGDTVAEALEQYKQGSEKRKHHIHEC